MKERLLTEFAKVFGGSEGAVIYFAPGRVNLIGEHTDYNGGHVFPCALTLGTYAAARKRKDKKLVFYSLNFKGVGKVESSLEDLTPKKEAGWTNYPKGVIWSFAERGMKPDCGMDLLLYGTIPNGAGLSSSASVEVLTGFILRDLFGFPVSNQELALIGQYSENHYNGVNCGIMDQFAVAMGKEGHAIFLDTSDLSYEYVPVSLENEKLIIACSNKKRGLADSKYNERREECEAALRELQQVIPINSLGELTEDVFETCKAAIKEEARRRRAKHAVYENRRTIYAMDALKRQDIRTFGRLMNESHLSLAQDYEVTGVEMDTLVSEAWKQEGVLGSRITGGGFGGCSISIVREDCVEAFIKNVGTAYAEKIGYEADFYPVEIGGPPCIMPAGKLEGKPGGG